MAIKELPTTGSSHDYVLRSNPEATPDNNEKYTMLSTNDLIIKINELVNDINKIKT